MDKNYFYHNRYENGNHIDSQNIEYFEERRPRVVSDDNVNEGSIEIIKDKLFFISSDTLPCSNDEAFYFTTDDLPELEYEPFNKDFGPLKLSMMHRYCCELVRLLQDPEYNKNIIYHYCSTAFDKQANGV